MSEMPPEGGGRTFLGLKPRTALIGGIGIVGAALLYFWWKGRSSPAAAASSASASAGSGATDYGGELSTIQSELEDLLAAEGQAGSGGGSSGSGGTTTTPGSGGTTTTPKKTATPPPKTTAKPKPAMPSAHETTVTPTSVTLGWAKVPDATSYRVRVTYQGELVGTPHLVTGTSATVSGLSPLRTYTFHVAAIGPGGTSSETNGPAVKTK